MRRFWIAGLAACVLASCTIDQTPERYIDRRETPVGEIETSRQELTARLLSSAVAVRRGDRAGLASALAPESDVFVLLSGEERDASATSRGAAVDALIRMADGAEVAMDEPVLTVAELNNIAWFRTSYRLLNADGEESVINFTGVFVRHDGGWRLVQGHLAPAITPPPPSPPPEDSSQVDG